MTHGALGMLEAILKFQIKMAQIWNRHTDNLFSRFLCLEHAQDAHEHTEQPTTQLGSVSFVDAVTGEVEASICQQIKLSGAYLKGG